MWKELEYLNKQNFDLKLNMKAILMSRSVNAGGYSTIFFAKVNQFLFVFMASQPWVTVANGNFPSVTMTDGCKVVNLFGFSHQYDNCDAF